MGKRLRRSGSPWRILVHEYLPGRGHRIKYGVSHHVSNMPDRHERDSEGSRQHVLEGTEFDELVVGSWIHVEQMSDRVFWMNVGGVTINISVDRDGRPRAVDVYGPDDWAPAEEGAKYSLTWRHDG
jgi:hypothetical protein